MIRIITDNASDITVEEAKKMTVEIVPLTINFEDESVQQKTAADFDNFYRKLETVQTLPSTSRPSPEDFLKHFEKAKEAGDEVLVLTIDAGSSGTLESAELARGLSGYSEKITIMDSKQAIMSQRLVVEQAAKLRDAGANMQEIVVYIKDLRERIVVCGVINTLKYLKMGGRVPKTMAFIGEAIGIKPIIILGDNGLDELAKKRGMLAGEKRLWQEMDKFPLDKELPTYFGYTLNREISENYRQKTIERYDLTKTGIFPIGGVIGTHVGPNGIGLAFVRK
ncbi:MAG TPA: DegV family protein [Candidatus Tetragenococcus pullicola]|nr:DegV family protein [Candidatus Tetragenococcus pullicola]